MIKHNFYFCQNEIIKTLYSNNKRKLIHEEINTNYIYVVLFLEDIPIGVAVAQELNPDLYELLDILVDKNFRGNNISTYLVKFLQTRIKTIGARKICVKSPYNFINFFYKLNYRNVELEYIDKTGKNYKNMVNILVKPRYKR